MRKILKNTKGEIVSFIIIVFFVLFFFFLIPKIFADDHIPVPDITIPNDLYSSDSNRVFIRGFKLSFQDQIIICFNTTECPMNGKIVAEGYQKRWFESLELREGENTLIAVAKTGENFSDQLVYTMYYVRSEDDIEDIIPADLENCLGDDIDDLNNQQLVDFYGNQASVIHSGNPGINDVVFQDTSNYPRNDPGQVYFHDFDSGFNEGGFSVAPGFLSEDEDVALAPDDTDGDEDDMDDMDDDSSILASEIDDGDATLNREADIYSVISQILSSRGAFLCVESFREDFIPYIDPSTGSGGNYIDSNGDGISDGFDANDDAVIEDDFGETDESIIQDPPPPSEESYPDDDDDCPVYFVEINNKEIYLGAGLLAHSNKSSDREEYFRINPEIKILVSDPVLIVKERQRELLYLNKFQLKGFTKPKGYEIYFDTQNKIHLLDKERYNMGTGKYYTFNDYFTNIKYTQRFVSIWQQIKKAGENEHSGLYNQFPILFINLQNRIREKEAREFDISSHMNDSSSEDVYIVVEGSLSNIGKLSRNIVTDILNTTTTNSFYNFINNHPDVAKLTTDVVNEFLGVSLEVFDKARNKWVKIPTEIINLEGNKKFGNTSNLLILPKIYSKSARFRLVNLHENYNIENVSIIFDDYKDKYHIKEFIIPLKNIEYKKHSKEISTVPDELIRYHDDLYIHIETGESLGFNFTLNEEIKNILSQSEDDEISIFINAGGYYEIGRNKNSLHKTQKLKK